ncbi:MAG: hypothetical protein RLZZ502_1489 [Pseudomonadota bacterium]
MSKVVTLYFSGYGHTKYIAEAVHAGAAAVAGTQAQLIAIDKNGDITAEAWDSLAQADAIILAPLRTWAWRLGSSRNLPMPRPSLGSRKPGKTNSQADSLTRPP